MKVLYRLIAMVLILASVVILHGRATAPVSGATPIEAEQAEEMNPLGELTSGDPEIDRLILEAGTKYGVDPKLIYYVIRQESQFKPKARSGKDARGLMQIIPATAERFDIENPYDPAQNIECGVRYLRWLLKRFNGDVKLALAGYNAGEGNVEKNGNRVPDFKETKNYVQKITSAYGKTYHPVLPPEQARAEFGLPTVAAE
ncbi:MAG TPA: lytic transglycosylase domain-containing protein [Blastocatellia bacterium]|nr:lytic transglycosylase domain-containing protein [Blastocatellia bacterium]